MYSTIQKLFTRFGLIMVQFRYFARMFLREISYTLHNHTTTKPNRAMRNRKYKYAQFTSVYILQQTCL